MQVHLWLQFLFFSSCSFPVLVTIFHDQLQLFPFTRFLNTRSFLTDCCSHLNILCQEMTSENAFKWSHILTVMKVINTILKLCSIKLKQFVLCNLKELLIQEWCWHEGYVHCGNSNCMQIFWRKKHVYFISAVELCGFSWAINVAKEKILLIMFVHQNCMRVLIT